MELLQILAGGFYLLNKVFLSSSERAKRKGRTGWSRNSRMAAWISCLIGLPAWVIIFIVNRNWIAASVEASAIPAMALGLIIAIRGIDKEPPRWLDRLAMIAIPLGFAYSLYDFGGLNTLSQLLEVILTVTFLVGTYLIAKEKKSGYLWYVVMHLSCGYLMWIEQLPWLMFQQLASLVFIIDAYVMARLNRH